MNLWYNITWGYSCFQCQEVGLLLFHSSTSCCFVLLFLIIHVRVVTGQGKVREILFFFKVREKSGDFAKW